MVIAVMVMAICATAQTVEKSDVFDKDDCYNADMFSEQKISKIYKILKDFKLSLINIKLTNDSFYSFESGTLSNPTRKSGSEIFTTFTPVEPVPCSFIVDAVTLKVFP